MMDIKEGCFELCRELVEEYEGWEFVTGQFKFKQAKFCLIGFGPFAKLSKDYARFEPMEWVRVNPITKAKKTIFPEQTISVDFTRQPRRSDGSFFSGLVTSMDQAELELRKITEYVMPQLLNRYDLSSVEAFVENFPTDQPDNFKGNQGVHYCLLRMLIGDFDFIHSYHEKALATSRGYRLEDIERILPYVDEMKANWEKTGKLM